MARHEFQPGKLIVGLFLTAAGAVFIGDAAGAWETPWFVAIPVVVGGTCLGGAAGTVARHLRRNRPSGEGH